jgi:hypothetical protein
MSARLAQSAPIARTRNKISSPFRATRFDLHLPLKYRLVGESGWREGTTENISRSGMLFQAEEPIAPNAQLEINLVLPAEIAGLSAAEVVCRGEVVRTARSEGEYREPDSGRENTAIPLPARLTPLRGVSQRWNDHIGEKVSARVGAGALARAGEHVRSPQAGNKSCYPDGL